MIWLVENTHGFFIAFFCLTTAFPSSLVVSLQPCQQSPTQCHSTEETARTPAQTWWVPYSQHRRGTDERSKLWSMQITMSCLKYQGMAKQKNKKKKPVPGIRGHGQSPLVDTGESSSLCPTSSFKCDFTQALSACAFLFAYLSVLPVL